MPRTYSKNKPTQYQRIACQIKDEGWIKEFLHKGMIAHVAHSQDEQPFITPNSYWYDENKHRIIFHSNIIGRIRSNLENFPKVCIEVSEYGQFLPANTALEFSLQYKSVMVFGTVLVLEGENEKKEALYGLINKYFPKMVPGVEFRPITDQELARTSVYSLRIESWSGKENWVDQVDDLPVWEPLSEEIRKANTVNRV